MLAFGANAWFAAPSHAAGAELVRQVAAIGAAAGHVPDVALRATGVHVRTWSADPSGLTERDLELARAVSAAAQELDLAADPSVLQTVQLTIDTAQQESAMRFWRTALAYDQLGDDFLVDPWHAYPSIWFQDMDVVRPLRNRVHLDVGLPIELMPERVPPSRPPVVGRFAARTSTLLSPTRKATRSTSCHCSPKATWRTRPNGPTGGCCSRPWCTTRRPIRRPQPRSPSPLPRSPTTPASTC